MKKITILSILFFLLNILIVNSQLAKVYNEENLDFDRAYRDNYLQERNYFSDLNYEIVTGGYSQTSKVGGPYYNDYKAINLNNQKKYVFDLLSCNSYEKYCVFRINGVPTGKIEKGATFRLDEQYSMKIEDIVFDFCDNRAFCHLGYEAYNIVDFIIDGTSLAICGNGVCESGENCEGDNCCNGETIELQITNPSTQVSVSTGTVSPATAVAISGTTTVAGNQAPSFTAFSNDGPKEPGEDITFSATSTDPNGDTVSLSVCKSTGYTTDTEWNIDHALYTRIDVPLTTSSGSFLDSSGSEGHLAGGVH